NENRTGRENRRLALAASGERTRPRVLRLTPPPIAPSGDLQRQGLRSVKRVRGGGRRERHQRAGALTGKLLAQSGVRSEDRCAMNRSARSQTCARVFIAAVLFAAFSWTLLVSISPRLHGSIHDDANRSEHVCAITLIASGSYEHASQ